MAPSLPPNTHSSLYGPTGQANLVFLNQGRHFHVLKSPSSPNLRQHTQTNKHSTGAHKACTAPVHPRRASRRTQARSAATAAGRRASDYLARRARKGRKERTGRGMKARSVPTARHLASKQRMCRWLRIGGCEVRSESRRRMWPAPVGCWARSLVRMCSVVADGLVVEVVSPV